jgi:hypothetical protein
MIIKLNDNVEIQEAPRDKEYNEDLFRHLKSKLEKSEDCHLNIVRRIVDSDAIIDTQIGYLYYLAKAYSLHKKVTLSPHDFWYIILSEISKIIIANPEKCRSLFTSSSEKVEISIPTGDVTEIDSVELLKALKNYVPVNTDIFLPKFSTATESYDIAAAATFAGGLKLYYNYSTYCCGIPEIKVTGTIADWKTIIDNLSVFCGYLKERNILEYENRKLSKWQSDVSEIIDMICLGLNGEDITDFMKDIFSLKNIGSGGQKKVTGWISKIYCAICEVPMLENFSLCIGTLPYTNKETGRKFIAAHGLFSTKKDIEGFTYPDYGHVTFEIVNKTVDQLGKLIVNVISTPL